MKVLPRFEANLLRVLHFFLQRVPEKRALEVIMDRLPQPPCLSRVGVELVQDSLAKGCVWLLARWGGWRRERHVRGDRIAEGRLWERTAPAELALTFTRETLRFLIWITAAKPEDHKPRWKPDDAGLSTGDQLFFYLAYTALRDTAVGPLLVRRSPFFGNVLCRLAYPDDFAGGAPLPTAAFDPWAGGTGGCVLEAMQPELARHWLLLERGKSQVRNWERMRAVGQAQEAMLTGLLQVLEKAARPDLARFLLQAAALLLPQDAAPRHWVGGLPDTGGRLADRMETYRAALAFLRVLDVLRHWERQARAVGYFDEGYAAAQAWKAEWERHHGDLLDSRAQAVIRQLDPLTFSPGGTSP
jgi:hypothetical protein